MFRSELPLIPFYLFKRYNERWSHLLEHWAWKGTAHGISALEAEAWNGSAGVCLRHWHWCGLPCPVPWLFLPLGYGVWGGLQSPCPFPFETSWTGNTLAAGGMNMEVCLGVWGFSLHILWWHWGCRHFWARSSPWLWDLHRACRVGVSSQPCLAAPGFVQALSSVADTLFCWIRDTLPLPVGRLCQVDLTAKAHEGAVLGLPHLSWWKPRLIVMSKNLLVTEQKCPLHQKVKHDSLKKFRLTREFFHIEKFILATLNLFEWTSEKNRFRDYQTHESILKGVMQSYMGYNRLWEFWGARERPCFCFWKTILENFRNMQN